MKLPIELLKPLNGKEIEIVDSQDNGLRGKKGKIVFETRNMFGILTDNRIIYVPKHICIFKIKLDKNRITIVNGRELVNRFMKLRKYGRKRR